MAALAAARSSRARPPQSPAAPAAAVPAAAPAPIAHQTVAASSPPWDDDLLSPAPVESVDPAQKKTESAVISLAGAPAASAAEPASDAWPYGVPPEEGALDGMPAADPLICDWPQLVRRLPLRGVVHQLAMQSELLSCSEDGAVLLMRIRVPVETLLSAGSSEKLAAALTEHYGKQVRLDTVIGVVSHTAHAADVAEQAERQRLAERTLQDDPFVQALMRDFGASFVPGSIRSV